MKPIKTVLIAPPFRGHLHPILGIAARLQQYCEVLIVSTPTGVAIARECGFVGRAVLEEREQEVWAIAEPGRSVRNNPLSLYRQLRGNIGLMAELKEELDGILDTEHPHLLIADFTIPAAGISAQRRGIVWWTTLPSPCVLETPDGPPAYFGGLLPPRSMLDRAQQHILRWLIRAFKRSMWWVFRGPLQKIGFKGVYRADGTEQVYSHHKILALGYPELEFAKSQPPHLHFIGPVLYTPPATGIAPTIPPGTTNVLVTLGTHLSHLKGPVEQFIRKLAKRHGTIHWHFTRGTSEGAEDFQYENFHLHRYLNYQAHLHKFDLVVHHGGAGILNYCIRLGLPAVVHPLDFDQFDNAARLVAAGVAVRAHELEDIERATLRGLKDEKLKARCRELASKVENYDAPATVLRYVQSRFDPIT